MSRYSKRQSEELDGLLETVQVNGYAITTIQKVLKLLGRVNDHQGAWDELLNMWEDDKSRSGTTLSGLCPGYNILILSTGESEKVSKWAGRKQDK